MDGNILRVFACISFIIAAVECFAGYKIMKALIAVWGFFIGLAVGVMAGVATDSALLAVFLIVVLGGALAFLSFKFYLAGVFALNAFLSGLAFYIIFTNELLAILFGALIGLMSIYFVKPIVILCTSISGAGILVASAYTMMKLDIGTNPIITAILWIPIALLGILVQFVTTKPTGRRSEIRSRQGSIAVPQTNTERRYPGMQRAYRNYCIRCGSKLYDGSEQCTKCGFNTKKA